MIKYLIDSHLMQVVTSIHIGQLVMLDYDIKQLSITQLVKTITDVICKVPLTLHK